MCDPEMSDGGDLIPYNIHRKHMENKSRDSFGDGQFDKMPPRMYVRLLPLAPESESCS